MSATDRLRQSFFDFYSSAAVGYRAYLPNEDTGDSGWWVWAYTAQLGNGLSATISAEQRRMSQILGFNGAAVPTLAGLTSGSIALGAVGNQTTTIGLGYGGEQVPDIVGNIRLDQTWGSTQIMAAAHEVNAPYYGSANLGLSATGHPGDQWGFVVAGGLRLNFPMVAQGDYFQGEVNYTHGALRYLNMGNNAPNFAIERGGTLGFGVLSDCVFGSIAAGISTLGGTGCNLTTGWSVNASYVHY
jgi:Porin subfamily